ncbi:hypothetical protein Q3A80_19595 [Burkholderia sp. SR8]|uniref:hypothetical protein n=1 Tax=Burkholderia sp. SR8 TaxID=3062277 RepID=UPI004063A36B
MFHIIPEMKIFIVDRNSEFRSTGSTEMTEATESNREEGAGNKRKAGRDRRSLLNVMRSRAYLYELIRRTNVADAGELKRAVLSEDGDSASALSLAVTWNPRFDRVINGNLTVTELLLKQVSQKKRLASARLIHEIGPEEDQGNVPLWAIFEDRVEEFDEIIESGLRLSPASDLGVGRVDRVALLFLPADQWHELRTSSDVAAGPNLAQRAYDAGYFTADVRRLATAIAFWMLCLKGADEWGPMETLLDWLMTGPYTRVIAQLGISEEMRDLLRMIAEDHHIQQGNVAAAARALTRFGTDGKRADPFG